MTERTRILISLTQEILGPRNGPYEILSEQNPRDEYITGVLTPPKTIDVLESDAEMIQEENDSEDSDMAVPPPVVPLEFSPALDPKSQSHSIGLSFVVENLHDDPKIEICATWARYTEEEDGWHRNPKHFLSSIITTNSNADNLKLDLEPNFRMHIRVKKFLDTSSVKARVSIFLVNEAKTEHPDIPDFVFQPQIRVHCLPETEVAPMKDYLPNPDEIDNRMAQEEETLALLYKDHLPKARGHLCGAIWREIDPERFHPEHKNTPMSPPFFWIDGELLPDIERKKFSSAEVRTEFVPIYSIQAPSMGWQEGYGKQPELNTLTLSELWEPHELREALQPLLN